MALQLGTSSSIFQMLVNEVLGPFEFAFGYLDDMLIFSPDIETHFKHLRIVFKRLREVDLKLKMEKCNFFTQSIQYLGHIVFHKDINQYKRS